MAWKDILNTVANVVSGSGQPEWSRRYQEDQENGGPIVEFPERDPRYNPDVQDLPRKETFRPDIPKPAPPVAPDYQHVSVTAQPRPTGNPTTVPGAAQATATTKSDANKYRDAFDLAMESYRKLAAIDPNDKAAMSKYGHGTYAPGTMKKVKGVMTDVGGQTKEDGVWGNIGKGMLLSMKNIAPVLLDRNVSDKTALGYAIGAAAGGGIGNGFKGTMDEQAKLEEDKARAMGNVQAAQGAYGFDVDTRVKEQGIEASDAAIAAREAKVKLDEEKLKDSKFNHATTRFSALTKAMKDGVLTRSQSKDFTDTMADLIGVDDVKISNFDPTKDTVKNTEFVSDAEGDRVMVVITHADGSQSKEWLVDPLTGKPAQIKGDRVKVAEIMAANRITTTGMTNESREKVAQYRIDFETKMKADDNLKAYAKDILIEFDRLTDAGTDPQTASTQASKTVAEAHGFRPK